MAKRKPAPEPEGQSSLFDEAPPPKKPAATWPATETKPEPARSAPTKKGWYIPTLDEIF
jgi:hypothetical protein